MIIYAEGAVGNGEQKKTKGIVVVEISWAARILPQGPQPGQQMRAISYMVLWVGTVL